MGTLSSHYRSGYLVYCSNWRPCHGVGGGGGAYSLSPKSSLFSYRPFALNMIGNSLNGGTMGKTEMNVVLLAGTELQKVFSEYSRGLPSETSKRLYLKAKTGQASPKTAIRAMCQHCCGYEDLKNRIGNCRVLKCPLWAYRPYTK